MTKLSHDEVQSIVADVKATFSSEIPDGLTEEQFCTLFSVGWICSGNSEWDYIQQVWEGGGDKPFPDQESIVQMFTEMDDEEVGKSDIIDQVVYLVGCGQRVIQRQSSTMDG